MIYVLITFIFLIPFLHFDVFNNKGRKMPIFYVECIIIIFFYGLRYHVGNDNFAYEEDFAATPDISHFLSQKNFEFGIYQPGWLLFCSSLKSILSKFWFLCLVHSIIVNTTVFYTIMKYSNHIFTASLVYFICFSPLFCSEIMRESMAVSIFLLSIPSLQNKKWLKYEFLCLCAIMFHIGAVVTIVMPLVFRVLTTQWSKRVVLLISFFTFVISIWLGSSLSDLLEFMRLSESVSHRVVGYQAHTQEVNESYSGTGGISISRRWVLSVFGYLLVLALLYKEDLKRPLYNFIVNIEFVLCITIPMLGIITLRYQNYFNILFYIIIIELLYNAKLYFHKFRIYVILVISCFSLSNYLYYVEPDVNGVPRYYLYSPYSSVLFPEKYPIREKMVQY